MGRTRVKIHAVEYLSLESVTAALENVHTVVSVTSAVDGTQAQVQINLLNAAVRAGCKRFAPSQWGFGPLGWTNVTILKMANTGVWEECLKHKEVIESAKFNQGSFMNYIGHGIYSNPTNFEKNVTVEQMRAGGGYAPGEDEACQGLLRQGDLSDNSGGFLIGLKNAIAELPVKGDGSWPRISMTSMKDVGQFVAESLELPKWEENMSMAGDTITMGELLGHAEEVTGKKFHVDVLEQARLEKKLSELAKNDVMGQLWTEFKLAYIRDRDDEVVLEPVVNRLCPWVKPMGVRQYMETFWTGFD
ncbi:hypothetical protein SLS61_010178 [Didymella pomorum]